MWLEPEPRDSLVELQSALQNEFPECDHVSRHKNGFTPHLSVGQVRNRAQLEETLADLQMSWLPSKFKVDAIQLIRRFDPPDDVFEVEQVIPLGSD
jgi:2'-5' RNA ligase